MEDENVDISQGHFGGFHPRTRSNGASNSSDEVTSNCSWNEQEERAATQEIHHSTIAQLIITNNSVQVMSPNEQSPKPVHRQASETDDTEWTELGPTFRYNHNRSVAGRPYIFHGEEINEVTGVKPAVIKLVSNNEKHCRHAKICRKLNHPHIVTALQVGSCMIGRLKHIYIALELCEEQNLYEYIMTNRDEKKPFNNKDTLIQTRQLTEAVCYIHSNNIIHRNLKPHNILLSLENKCLKITDFAMGVEIDDARNGASYAAVGTPGYRAAEVCNNNECTASSDIFSLGLTFYFLWSYGLHPFGEDSDEWNINIKRCKDPTFRGLLIDDIDKAVQLLREMLHHSPSQRPTADQLSCFEFFSASRKYGSRKKGVRQDEQSSCSSQTSRNTRSVTNRPEHLGVVKAPVDFAPRTKTVMKSVETPSPSRTRDLGPKDKAATDQSKYVGPKEEVVIRPKEKAATNQSKHMGPEEKVTTDQSKDMGPSNVSEAEGSLKNQGLNVRGAPNHSSARQIRTKRRPSQLYRPHSATELTLGLFDQNNRFDKELFNRIIFVDKLLSGTRIFNPTKSTWNPMHIISPALSAQNFTAVTLSGYIYLLFNDKNVFRLKISKFNAMWENLPRMKYYHGEYPPALATRGKIYVVGSAGGACEHPIRSIECFDQSANAWSDREEPMSIARYHHAISVSKEYIYCIGGVYESAVLDSVELYDCYRKSWCAAPPMTYRRANPSAVYRAGNLYVLGGYCSNSFMVETRLASVEVYDGKRSAWTVLMPMLKPRALFTALIINGEIYVVGGDEKRKSNAGQDKVSIEHYSFPGRKWSLTSVKRDVRIDSMSAAAAYMLD